VCLGLLLTIGVGAALVVRAVVGGGREALPEVKTSVNDLYTGYGKDLAAADLKFQNKQLELSGVTGKVEKDDQGRYFIGACVSRVVKSGDGKARVMSIDQVQRRVYEAALNAKYVPGVMLYLKPDDLNQFTGLDGNKAITVRGRCKGSRTDPSTIPDYVVIIEDCTLVGGK
jgi:hypothetical protein